MRVRVSPAAQLITGYLPRTLSGSWRLPPGHIGLARQSDKRTLS